MKKITLIALVIVLVFTLCVMVTGYYLATSTADRLAQKRQAIIDAGDPVHLSDLQQAPIPDEDNGIAKFEIAIPDLEKFSKRHDELINRHGDTFGPRYKLNADRWDEGDAILAEFPELFAQLEAAANSTKFASTDPTNQDPLSSDYFQNATHLRTATKALTTKALSAARRGNADEALSVCETALKLQAIGRARPMLLTFLVQIANEAIIFDTVNHILRITRPSDEALKSFGQYLADNDHEAFFQEAAKGERAFGISIFSQIREGDGDVSELDYSIPLSGTWFGQAYLNDDMAMYLDLMDAKINNISEPHATRTARFEQLLATLQQSKYRFILSKLLIPSFQETHRAFTRIQAQQRAMQVLCEHPDAVLDATIIPETPKQLDPFLDSTPMSIRQSPEGLIVYSVGENLLDDGGQTAPPQSSQRSLDVGYGPLLERN